MDFYHTATNEVSKEVEEKMQTAQVVWMSLHTGAEIASPVHPYPKALEVLKWARENPNRHLSEPRLRLVGERPKFPGGAPSARGGEA